MGVVGAVLLGLGVVLAIAARGMSPESPFQLVMREASQAPWVVAAVFVALCLTGTTKRCFGFESGAGLGVLVGAGFALLAYGLARVLEFDVTVALAAGFLLSAAGIGVWTRSWERDELSQSPGGVWCAFTLAAVAMVALANMSWQLDARSVWSQFTSLVVWAAAGGCMACTLIGLTRASDACVD